MEQSPSWEANRPSAGQGIPRILWDAKVYCRFHQRRHLSLSQTRSIQHTPLHHTSWRTILILSLPSRSRSSMWSRSLRAPNQNSVRTSCVPHKCHMLCQSHSSWFVYPNNIWWAVQIIKNVHLENVLFKRYVAIYVFILLTQDGEREDERNMYAALDIKEKCMTTESHCTWSTELLYIVTNWFAAT